MPTTPTGLLGLPLTYLRAQLSQSAAFIARTGAANAAAALAFIHYHDLPAPANGAEYTEAELATHRPYAIVSHAPTELFRGRRIAGGYPATYSEAGRVMLYIVDDIATGDIGSESEYSIKWGNFISSVIDELLALSGTAGYLAISNIDVNELVANHPLSGEGSGRISRATITCHYSEDE